MTDHDDVLDSDARRSFMKKGALATGALALGGAGTAAAQDGTEVDDGDVVDLDEAGGKALITVDNFHPRGRFVFVSGVLEWTPSVPDVDDSLWSQYNTYQIRWLGTNEIVPLWVTQDADVADYDEDLGYVPDINEDVDRPQAWEMNQQWTPLGDNPALITVQFSPVDEENEDAILDNDQWWGEDEEDGVFGDGTPGADGNETGGGGVIDENETDVVGDDATDVVGDDATDVIGNDTGNDTNDGLFENFF